MNFAFISSKRVLSGLQKKISSTYTTVMIVLPFLYQKIPASDFRCSKPSSHMKESVRGQPEIA